MKLNKTLGVLVLSVVAIVAAAPRAHADESGASINAIAAGTIVGVVTNSAKAPVGGATVTAARAGGGIRSTVSGSDGVYSFADVAPGAWVLTSSVEGFPDDLVYHVERPRLSPVRRPRPVRAPRCGSLHPPRIAGWSPRSSGSIGRL